MKCLHTYLGTCSVFERRAKARARALGPSALRLMELKLGLKKKLKWKLKRRLKWRLKQESSGSDDG